MTGRSRIATGATAVAAGLVATLAWSATPQADAAVRTRYIAQNCYGVNPNLSDVPSYGGATVTTDTTEPGKFSINSDSKSFLPYRSDTTIKVTSLTTGKSLVYKRRWQHGLGDNSGYFISDIPAKGPTRITITSVNHGILLSLPGPTCTGTITI